MMNNEHMNGFLNSIKVQRIDSNMRGITWLEMYILYKLRGYKQPIDDPTCVGHARATADKQLVAFKNLVRAVSSKLYLKEKGKSMFTPAVVVNENLKGIGILGKQHGPSFNIYITKEEQKQIAKHLHRLNHTINKVKLEAVVLGEAKFVPRKLNMRGGADWNSEIKPLKEPWICDQDKWNRDIEYGIQNYKNKEVVFLQCNRCKCYEPDYSINLDIYDVEKGIKCTHCKKTSPSHQWKCICGINWFICDKHRWCTKSVTRTRKEESENKKSDKELTKSSKKQKTGNASIPEIMASYKELLKEDLVNEEKRLRQLGNKAKGEVVLGTSKPQAKRPRLLGPILDARFPLDGRKDEMESVRRTDEQNGFGVEFDPTKTKKPRLSGTFQCGNGEQPNLLNNGTLGEMQPGSSGQDPGSSHKSAGSGEMQPDPRGSSSSR